MIVGHAAMGPRLMCVDFGRGSTPPQVFQLALAALQQLQTDPVAADDKLREQAVSLALGALSFDFVGTCLDESSEDLGTIQVRRGLRRRALLGRTPSPAAV